MKNDPSCPAKLEAPPGNCKIGLTCMYPQGRCKCLDYCGGPPPPPNEDMSHWSCETFQDNGCPIDPPKEGSQCKPTGKECDYAECCTQSFYCTAGVWKGGPMLCPP